MRGLRTRVLIYEKPMNNLLIGNPNDEFLAGKMYQQDKYQIEIGCSFINILHFIL